MSIKLLYMITCSVLPLIMASIARSSKVFGASVSVSVSGKTVDASTVVLSTIPDSLIISVFSRFCICRPNDEADCASTSGFTEPFVGCNARAGTYSSFLCLALARQSELGRGDILRGATSFFGSALRYDLLVTMQSRLQIKQAYSFTLLSSKPNTRSSLIFSWSSSSLPKTAFLF